MHQRRVPFLPHVDKTHTTATQWERHIETRKHKSNLKISHKQVADVDDSIVNDSDDDWEEEDLTDETDKDSEEEGPLDNSESQEVVPGFTPSRHQTVTSSPPSVEADASSSSSAPSYLREWGVSASQSHEPDPTSPPTVSNTNDEHQHQNMSDSKIPVIIDLSMEEPATNSRRGSPCVPDDSHLLPDLKNIQSVRFHFWSASKNSAHVESYEFCQNPHQLFSQARVARLWKPDTSYRVLELRLRNDDYDITMCDPEVGNSIKTLEKFNAFILEVRARVAKDVSDLIIDVKAID